MELQFPFAKHLLIQYELNLETNYYKLVDAPPGFKKLPDELRIEETQKLDRIDAPFILRSRIVKGFYSFLTGLRLTHHKRIFYGDNGYKKPKQKSLLFAVYSRDRRTMDIYFFYNFYPLNPAQRERIIESFVQPFLTD
jgi:hypothetical protein